MALLRDTLPQNVPPVYSCAVDAIECVFKRVHARCFEEILSHVHRKLKDVDADGVCQVVMCAH